MLYRLCDGCGDGIRLLEKPVKITVNAPRQTDRYLLCVKCGLKITLEFDQVMDELSKGSVSGLADFLMGAGRPDPGQGPVSFA